MKIKIEYKYKPEEGFRCWAFASGDGFSPIRECGESWADVRERIRKRIELITDAPAVAVPPSEEIDIEP